MTGWSVQDANGEEHKRYLSREQADAYTRWHNQRITAQIITGEIPEQQASWFVLSVYPMQWDDAPEEKPGTEELPAVQVGPGLFRDETGRLWRAERWTEG